MLIHCVCAAVLACHPRRPSTKILTCNPPCLFPAGVDAQSRLDSAPHNHATACHCQTCVRPDNTSALPFKHTSDRFRQELGEIDVLRPINGCQSGDVGHTSPCSRGLPSSSRQRLLPRLVYARSQRTGLASYRQTLLLLKHHGGPCPHGIAARPVHMLLACKDISLLATRISARSSSISHSPEPRF